MLTQLVGQLVAEHGQRGGQSSLPGGCEGGAHGQPIGEVVYSIAQRDQVRQQSQFCGHGQCGSQPTPH